MNKIAELVLKSNVGNMTIPMEISDFRLLANRDNFKMLDVELTLSKTMKEIEVNLLRSILNEKESSKDSQKSFV